MDKQTLIAAIKNSGGADRPDEEVDALLVKLDILHQTSRYTRLLNCIASANDKSNLLAAVFEATFAYQFEVAGLPLEYEVKQDKNDNSSIDFLRRMNSGVSIYFEARLLQQDLATTVSIQTQLQQSKFYQAAMNGQMEHDAIVRLQSTILSKVQKADGTQTKFFRVAADSLNIVVIDASDLILGMLDIADCMLATHGDPSVRKECRRNIFGLFQEPDLAYPAQIPAIAEHFERIRNTLSGVLFLFKSRGSGVINYTLEHYMIWNPRLIDVVCAQDVNSEISRAIGLLEKE